MCEYSMTQNRMIMWIYINYRILINQKKKEDIFETLIKWMDMNNEKIVTGT